MPQNLWIDDEDPNSLTRMGKRAGTIRLTHEAFRQEFNKVFEEVERMLPVDYEKGEDTREKPRQCTLRCGTWRCSTP